MKYDYNLKYQFSILIYLKILYISVTQSWIFSIINSVFSVTWSFRNHSNMLLKKHFLLLILKTIKNCFLRILL